MTDETVVETTEEVATEEVDVAPRKATKVVGISKEAKLTVLVESNPKRPGSSSYDRFEGYFKDGIETVQDALDAGLIMGDIKHDSVHGFIEVEGAEVEEYEVKARGPRGTKEIDPDLETDPSSVDDLLEDAGEEADIFAAAAAA